MPLVSAKARAEEPQHLTYALIIPGQLATAGDVPPDVFREVLAPQRVEVAPAKGLEPPAH